MIWGEQQNSGGLCNEVWKVCSVFGGQGLLDLPEGLSSSRTLCQRLSRAVQAFRANTKAELRNVEIRVSQTNEVNSSKPLL